MLSKECDTEPRNAVFILLLPSFIFAGVHVPQSSAPCYESGVLIAGSLAVTVFQGLFLQWS